MRMANIMKCHCGKTTRVDVLFRSLCHLGDIIRGFGEGDLLALLATKGSFVISTYLSRGLYHGEVISILFFRAIAFVTVICDKCCIRTMCD
jgi:hypothetical protein